MRVHTMRMRLDTRKTKLLFVTGLAALLLFSASQPAASSDGPYPWPPKLHEGYPDIPFLKPDGSIFKMSDVKGRFVVIHYRGMTCPACQNMAARRDLMWNDPKVVNVDVLLFNREMKPPTAEDARWWAEKYGLKESNREIVVSGPAWTNAPALYRTTYDMVVGGQLLDDMGVVQASVVRPPGAKLPPHYWPDLREMLTGWLQKPRE